jgi:hypothetical protein
VRSLQPPAYAMDSDSVESDSASGPFFLRYFTALWLVKRLKSRPSSLNSKLIRGHQTAHIRFTGSASLAREDPLDLLSPCGRTKI